VVGEDPDRIDYPHDPAMINTTAENVSQLGLLLSAPSQEVPPFGHRGRAPDPGRVRTVRCVRNPGTEAAAPSAARPPAVARCERGHPESGPADGPGRGCSRCLHGPPPPADPGNSARCAGPGTPERSASRPACRPWVPSSTASSVNSPACPSASRRLAASSARVMTSRIASRSAAERVMAAARPRSWRGCHQGRRSWG
jgi:hypothetical protein